MTNSRSGRLLSACCVCGLVVALVFLAVGVSTSRSVWSRTVNANEQPLAEQYQQQQQLQHQLNSHHSHPHSQYKHDLHRDHPTLSESHAQHQRAANRLAVGTTSRKRESGDFEHHHMPNINPAPVPEGANPLSFINGFIEKLTEGHTQPHNLGRLPTPTVGENLHMATHNNNNNNNSNKHHHQVSHQQQQQQTMHMTPQSHRLPVEVALEALNQAAPDSSAESLLEDALRAAETEMANGQLQNQPQKLKSQSQAQAQSQSQSQSQSQPQLQSQPQDEASMGAGSLETIDDDGTHSAAGHGSTRHASNQRFDVPQIECPMTDEGVERFACPTPEVNTSDKFRCIFDHAICDGYEDCPGGEDEDRLACMFYKTTKAHLDVMADALLRWARRSR